MGGYSHAKLEDLFSTRIVEEAIDQSHLGNFSRIELDNKISSSFADVNIILNNYQEGLSGQAVTKNTKELFELIYLNFTSVNFNQTVIALLDKIGFVRGGEKWRDFEKQPRWVHYGNGHPMNICSEQAQPSWHIDRFCQRCFKIFIHPNKEGFFEVLVTVLQILDRHFDHFEGKIMSQSSPAHIPMRSNRKGPWDNHDRIIVYSMATPEDKDKSLGHFYNKASHVINKLKSGLAHLEQYAETSGRPPYTKQVTNLIFVRQGGGYHRVKGDGYKDEELTPKYPMQFEGNHWEFIKPDLPQSGK